jgi:predicted outer membrane lipoprotein
MSNITYKSVFSLLWDIIFQNGTSWILGLLLATIFYFALFGALWLFDKHSIMKAPKKKYFFVGISLLFAVFFGLVFIFCGMMTSVTRHLNRQVEDMRIAAIGRESRGLIAGVLSAGPITTTNKMPSTNAISTLQGMPTSQINRTMESGVDAALCKCFLET